MNTEWRFWDISKTYTDAEAKLPREIQRIQSNHLHDGIKVLMHIRRDPRRDDNDWPWELWYKLEEVL